MSSKIIYVFSDFLLHFSQMCAILFLSVSYEVFGIERNRLTEELWRIP